MIFRLGIFVYSLSHVCLSPCVALPPLPPVFTSSPPLTTHPYSTLSTHHPPDTHTGPSLSSSFSPFPLVSTFSVSTYTPTTLSSCSPPTSHPHPLFPHKGPGNPISQVCAGGHAWCWFTLPPPPQQERESRRRDTLLSGSIYSGVVLNAAALLTRELRGYTGCLALSHLIPLSSPPCWVAITYPLFTSHKQVFRFIFPGVEFMLCYAWV